MAKVGTQLELLCELGQYPEAWTQVTVSYTGTQYWLCPRCARTERLTFEGTVLVYPLPPLGIHCEGWVGDNRCSRRLPRV